MIKFVTITGSGQITLPADMRRRHGLEIGDRVMVSENLVGQIVVGVPKRSFEELAGSFRLKPGIEADDDFGNLIREAMDDRADRIAARMQAEDEGE